MEWMEFSVVILRFLGRRNWNTSSISMIIFSRFSEHRVEKRFLFWFQLHYMRQTFDWVFTSNAMRHRLFFFALWTVNIIHSAISMHIRAMYLIIFVISQNCFKVERWRIECAFYEHYNISQFRANVDDGNWVSNLRRQIYSKYQVVSYMTWWENFELHFSKRHI